MYIQYITFDFLIFLVLYLVLSFFFIFDMDLVVWNKHDLIWFWYLVIYHWRHKGSWRPRQTFVQSCMPSSRFGLRTWDHPDYPSRLWFVNTVCHHATWNAQWVQHCPVFIILHFTSTLRSIVLIAILRRFNKYIPTSECQLSKFLHPICNVSLFFGNLSPKCRQLQSAARNECPLPVATGFQVNIKISQKVSKCTCTAQKIKTSQCADEAKIRSHAHCESYTSDKSKVTFDHTLFAGNVVNEEKPSNEQPSSLCRFIMLKLTTVQD